MSRNPYKGLPDHCFWSRAHRVEKIDPVVAPSFRIKPDTKIATAGSCFAQHIARHLQQAGYSYFVAEQAHPIVSPTAARRAGYGVFSARYGNIYTVRQLLQLARRAYGQFSPEEDVWTDGDRLIDPFRPNVQPGGFVSETEFRRERETHLAAVRRVIEEADVFVFTLGLTEAWEAISDGSIFPLAPGVAGGTFDPDRHRFVNFRVEEIVADFEAFTTIAREKNSDLRLLLTVSPVPLIATARPEASVITATAYSKAALRVAAEILSDKLPACDYFPSYEIITSPSSKGTYFADDLRDVTPQGVEHVMAVFMRHYVERKKAAVAQQTRDEDEDVERFVESNISGLDVICDEELIVAKG